MSHRIVVITGAAAGLGLSLAKQFLGEEDTVYGLTRTRRHWQSAREKVGRSVHFILLQADVRLESAVKKALAEIHRQAGRIDILINNAGYAGRLVKIEEETAEGFKKHFSGNLLATFLMCKYALPFFEKQRNGWIVNISSMAGKRAVPLLGSYSASKFGVVALSQAIAKENPDAGFRCITICPGGMNTTMRAGIFGKADAGRQQSTDFVAEKIVEIIDGKIEVESGGDVVIRHGRVTAVNPPPEA